MSPSEPPADAGFTLFEMLVSLAILATILGISATALRTPSPAFQLDRQLGDLSNAISLARERAVRSGQAVAITLPSCGDTPRTEALFFSDGTARATDPVCVAVDDLTQRLHIDPLTARIEVQDE